MRFISILLIYLFIHYVLAKKRRFEFNVQRTELNPDCSKKSFSSLTINGQSPGPIIRVVKNDFVEILVKNSGENNQSTSIHFHGIYQLNTNSEDGVAGVTQLAIPPGKSFLHKFQIKKQAGTFYYHAHVGTQDTTVQGPLIVYENEESLKNAERGPRDNKMVQEGPYKYHEERILQWSEWWHESFYSRGKKIMDPNYDHNSGPQSILLNGRSIYDDYKSHNCKGYTVIDVKPNSIYRLRFIGALTFRMLGITISDHNMTLIEIDSEYVQPHPIDHLELMPGQRSSVLIQTGNYTKGTMFPITSQFKWRVIKNSSNSNGFGFIRYVDDDSKDSNISVVKSPSSFSVKKVPSVNGWVLPQLRPLVPGKLNILTAIPSRTIRLAMQEVMMPDNTTRFKNNGRVHKPWGNSTASLLDQLKNDSDYGEISYDGFSVKHQTYPIGLGEIVDIVFQNMKSASGNCLPHPWHTHGHAHYLLAQGDGDYDDQINVINYKEPLLKDVSMQYMAPVNGTIPCGWTKVRVHLNNPGFWAVHCHITGHMLQGKMVIFEVKPSKVPLPNKNCIA